MKSARLYPTRAPVNHIDRDDISVPGFASRLRMKLTPRGLRLQTQDR